MKEPNQFELHVLKTSIVELMNIFSKHMSAYHRATDLEDDDLSPINMGMSIIESFVSSSLMTLAHKFELDYKEEQRMLKMFIEHLNLNHTAAINKCREDSSFGRDINNAYVSEAIIAEQKNKTTTNFDKAESNDQKTSTVH